MLSIKLLLNIIKIQLFRKWNLIDIYIYKQFNKLLILL